MVGIYGNHPEDRARERQLDDWLDSLEDQLICMDCNIEVDDEDELSDGICKDCRGEEDE